VTVELFGSCTALIKPSPVKVASKESAEKAKRVFRQAERSKSEKWNVHVKLVREMVEPRAQIRVTSCYNQIISNAFLESQVHFFVRYNTNTYPLRLFDNIYRQLHTTCYLHDSILIVLNNKLFLLTTLSLFTPQNFSQFLH
jgi:hypothetical protein